MVENVRKTQIDAVDGDQGAQRDPGAKLEPSLISVPGFPLENLLQITCPASPPRLSLREGLALV